ncbi:MAG TPA: hypothetical protein PLL69_02795, partial [Gemmatimonadales bacterium]|nr:hypothetical protein [Gemmatimonadales bacterium]
MTARHRAECRAAGLALVMLVGGLPAQSPADPGYRVGVVSESGDAIRWFRPTESGLELDRLVPIDPRPPERDGPHNITVA